MLKVIDIDRLRDFGVIVKYNQNGRMNLLVEVKNKLSPFLDIARNGRVMEVFITNIVKAELYYKLINEKVIAFKEDVVPDMEIEYKGIKMVLMQRADYKTKKAKRYQIIPKTNGLSNQNIWIPNMCLLDNGRLKKNADLDFVFSDETTKHKLELAGYKVVEQG